MGRTRTPPAKPAKPPPRIAWPLIVAAVAAVVLAGAAAVREVVSSDEDTEGPALVERRGSARVAERDPIEHGTAPSTWRIRYLIATSGSEHTETVTVRAPFESHTDVRSNGTFSESRESALGVAATKPARGGVVVLAPPPEAAGYRPGPILAAALEHGLVERRERRRVAKRECQVYRTASTFGGTTFADAASDHDYVDVCVDSDGLLLEQLETFEGRILRQRVALEVSTDVEVEDSDLSTLPREQTIPANEGGGSIRRVDPASRPVGPFLDVVTPPAGFERLGRYEVIPPQPEIAKPETRGHVVAAMSDVFVRGSDVIVVERGARLDTGPPWDEDERFPDIDLGPTIGTGEFLAGVTGGEVRALLGSGRFVRVYGTVPLDVLIGVARSLVATDGGTGPVYLDG